jgi:hypothetical protein
MSRRAWIAGACVLALLITARLALPGVIARAVNSSLAGNPTYEGTIGGIDVALWRGEYTIRDVDIRKRNGRVPIPFVAAPRVELSVEWSALLDGAFVGEVIFVQPELNFVRGTDAETSQSGVGGRWREVVQGLFPIRINRVEVRDGSIHFRDLHADPRVDVYLSDVELIAQNLTNATDDPAERVARLNVEATPMNRGRLIGRATFDPWSETPDFDLDGELTNADLTQWNDLTRAYAAFDVESGTVAIYTELEAADGGFEGYVKPFFTDVEILSFPREVTGQNPLRAIWEILVAAAANAFEDRDRERVAARIPISGTVSDPDGNFWYALGSTIENAFIRSIPARLEGSVGES